MSRQQQHNLRERVEGGRNAPTAANREQRAERSRRDGASRSRADRLMSAFSKKELNDLYERSSY